MYKMKNFKFEYVWLDGYTPEPNFRSKTRVISMNAYDGNVGELPIWSFDGSSTKQAEGSSSDCLLKPVRTYCDKTRKNGWLVLCEVLNPDGTPHASNTRALYNDMEDLWLGFEQEYVLMNGERPLGFPKYGYPEPQGKYYCSVGHRNVVARDLVEHHLDMALESGIQVTGINAEVLLGQWEFQVFGKGAKKAADDLLIARYLLHRAGEQFGLEVSLHPKPLQGDWNGSGMHTNFSTQAMRKTGGKKLMVDICEAMKETHQQHIENYGSLNELRLTGMHETQSIDTFSYGVSDRGASIRIPVSVPENGWKGYLEDRRPASNADPYKVVARIVETILQMNRVQKKAA